MLLWLLFLLGFSALASQVIYLRELTIVFYGNELAFSAILASWLFFGGLGGIFGALIIRKAEDIQKWCGGLFILLAAALPATLFLVRLSRNMLGIPQGEVIGVAQIYLISFFTLSVPAFLLSLLFTFSVEMIRQRRPDCEAPTRCYVFEAVGSGVAGLLLSFFLLRYWNSFEIILFIGALIFFSGSLLLLGRKAGILAGTTVVFLSWFTAPFFQKVSLEKQWKNYALLESTDSPYGNLVVAKKKDQVSFFGNGFLLQTIPNPEVSESTVHSVLAMHPKPDRVLLLGESSPEFIREALKHPVREITAVELDPLWLDFKRIYSGIPLETLGAKVRFIPGDGRRFIKSERDRFDVVMIALPEPSTLLINRFYTAEFFEEVKERLTEDGILALELPGIANYISQELVVLIQSIKISLEEVFPYHIILPMQSTHLLGATKRGLLKDQADDLIKGLRSRGVKALFFNENYVPFYLTELRKQQLAMRLDALHGVSDNRDLKPTAQFYTTLYWSAYASGGMKEVLQKIIRLPQILWFLVPAVWFLLLAVFRGRLAFKPLTVLNSMAWTGFSEIGFEMVIILAYQAIYGYAYLWIAVILASFMLGLVLGSTLTLAVQSAGNELFQRLRTVQFSIVFYPLFLILILFLLREPKVAFHPLVEFSFPFLAIVAGFFGGLQFPLAQRILAEGKGIQISTGIVYGVDLMGSCLGALVIGSLLVPVLGTVKVCLLLSTINLGSWGLLAIKK